MLQNRNFRLTKRIFPEERIAEDMEPANEKTIHFTPSKQDVLKASFYITQFPGSYPDIGYFI